jgi:hypothetical protein
MPKWIDKKTQKDKNKNSDHHQQEALDEFGEPIGKPCRSNCGCVRAYGDAISDYQPSLGGGVRGALVAPSDEVPTETPRPRRFNKQVNKERLCENFMASCKCSGEKFGGHIQAVSFVEQAEVVRSQCMAERERCSCTEAVPTCIMTDDRPINEIQGGGKFFDGGWQMITMAVDSGAAETLIPHTLVMGHLIMETEA